MNNSQEYTPSWATDDQPSEPIGPTVARRTTEFPEPPTDRRQPVNYWTTYFDQKLGAIDDQSASLPRPGESASPVESRLNLVATALQSKTRFSRRAFIDTTVRVAAFTSIGAGLGILGVGGYKLVNGEGPGSGGPRNPNTGANNGGFDNFQNNVAVAAARNRDQAQTGLVVVGSPQENTVCVEPYRKPFTVNPNSSNFSLRKIGARIGNAFSEAWNFHMVDNSGCVPLGRGILSTTGACITPMVIAGAAGWGIHRTAKGLSWLNRQKLTAQGIPQDEQS